MKQCVGRLRGESLGERLLYALEVNPHYNRHSLAKELGTSWHHVNMWCQGKVEPKAARLKQIAEVLDLNLNELLGVNTNSEPAYKGWKMFLGTPEGSSALPSELAALSELVWPIDREPTATSYLLALQSMRATLRLE
tara:strand:+ start:190 stop:600 length:411 start_codon:yes stop_codon:yes gene_type:complete